MKFSAGNGLFVFLSIATIAFGGTAQAASDRFATFNASLNRSSEGQLITDLSTALP